MREILDGLERFRLSGERCVLARVVSVEGSGPRLPGAAMAVNEHGDVIGSVSGGCIEGAVVAESMRILESIDDPTAEVRRLVSYGYSDEDAFAVGLTCGGTIRLFIEPFDW